MNYGSYIIYALFNVRQTIFRVCFVVDNKSSKYISTKCQRRTIFLFFINL